MGHDAPSLIWAQHGPMVLDLQVKVYTYMGFLKEIAAHREVHAPHTTLENRVLQIWNGKNTIS